MRSTRERNYIKFIELKKKNQNTFYIQVVAIFGILRKISDSKNPMQTLTKILSTALGI